MEKRGVRWEMDVEWEVPGEVGRKKGPRAEHFDGFFDNKRLSEILRGAGGSDGEKEERKTACPNFSGRQAGVLGKQKTGWAAVGRLFKEKPVGPARHSPGRTR